jgi:hypothetical protein
MTSTLGGHPPSPITPPSRDLRSFVSSGLYLGSILCVTAAAAALIRAAAAAFGNGNARLEVVLLGEVVLDY